MTRLCWHRRSAPGAWRRAKKTRRSGSKSGSGRWSHSHEIRSAQSEEILHGSSSKRIARPQMSKQSRRIDWILRFETRTVFGTESFFDLEPQAGKRGKIPIESMVGVKGFVLSLRG